MQAKRSAKSQLKTAMDLLLEMFKPQSAKAPPENQRCYRCGAKFKTRAQKPGDAYDTMVYCQESCSFVPALADVRKISRQELRAELRKEAHKHIRKVAGGEPRRARRAMALALSNRQYRQRHESIEADAGPRRKSTPKAKAASA